MSGGAASTSGTLGAGHLRGFATAAFTVPARGSAKSQALFVVGLNQGKFFGQDSAEEGLKLVERVATHHPQYHLLFSLTERHLAEVEADHQVKNQRLTPSRDLEQARYGEFIPMVQVGMVEKRPRKALGRSLRTSQSHVAWQLWKHPREAVKAYWAYWRRKDHLDAARSRFWLEHFPVCAAAHFDENAELLAIRALEQLISFRAQDQEGSAILVVSNDLFALTADHVRRLLGEDPAGKLGSADFQRQLRDRAAELCLDVPDLTALLVFVYLGLPLLTLQFVGLAIQTYVSRSGVLEKVIPVEERD